VAVVAETDPWCAKRDWPNYLGTKSCRLDSRGMSL
jgi:hypothetical protein